MRKSDLHKIIFLVCFWSCCTIFIVFYDASILGFKSEIEGEHYKFFRVLIGSVIVTIMGSSLLGSLEVLYLSRVLRKKPFSISLLIKTIIYLAFILVFVTIVVLYMYSREINQPLFSNIVIKNYLNFLTSSRFIMMTIFWGIACILALFTLEVNEKFGKGVLLNFILGKYHSPKEEIRIFMFLDLTSATTIAEKLGPQKYSSFLKDFFFDIDSVINITNGAVFQFVGDEVVIIWDINKGTEKQNCINFFFLAENKINSLKKVYIAKYGVCPDFKAGLHVGKVIITEVGRSKSEIAYHGDTINTASRIRSVCNKYDKKFLASSEIINLMNKLDEEFLIDSMGVCTLKGKEKAVTLFSIERISNLNI